MQIHRGSFKRVLSSRCSLGTTFPHRKGWCGRRNLTPTGLFATKILVFARLQFLATQQGEDRLPVPNPPLKAAIIERVPPAWSSIWPQPEETPLPRRRFPKEGFRLRGSFDLRRGQSGRTYPRRRYAYPERCKVVWVGRPAPRGKGEFGWKTL